MSLAGRDPLWEQRGGLVVGLGSQTKLLASAMHCGHDGHFPCSFLQS